MPWERMVYDPRRVRVKSSFVNRLIDDTCLLACFCPGNLLLCDLFVNCIAISGR